MLIKKNNGWKTTVLFIGAGAEVGAGEKIPVAGQKRIGSATLVISDVWLEIKNSWIFRPDTRWIPWLLHLLPYIHKTITIWCVHCSGWWSLWSPVECLADQPKPQLLSIQNSTGKGSSVICPYGKFSWNSPIITIIKKRDYHLFTESVGYCDSFTQPSFCSGRHFLAWNKLW